MENKLNILCQSSDFYCPFCGVMLESLFYNNTDIEFIKVYLISDNIGEDNMRKLKELSEKYGRNIEIIDGNLIAQHLEENGCPKYNGSYTTYFKLFAQEYINDDIDRLLYLDSDIIVNGSLRDLLSLDMNGKIMGMVIDMAPEEHKEEINCPNYYYYNAGVILYDYRKWRDNNYSAMIVEHLKNSHPIYTLADQDILNVVLGNEIYALDLKWNFFTDLLITNKTEWLKYIFGVKNYYTEEDFQNGIKNRVVCHLSGSFTGKPWMKNNSHPLNEIWDRFLDQSPWNGYEKLSNNKIVFIAKCRLILFKIMPKKLFGAINQIALKIFLKR